jgi:hypothetical protein
VQVFSRLYNVFREVESRLPSAVIFLLRSGRVVMVVLVAYDDGVFVDNNVRGCCPGVNLLV